MLTVFVCGHGAWFGDDLFFGLPKGCNATFYTHHGKQMLQDAVFHIVGGTYTREPENVIPEYRLCPNMTVAPDDQHWVQPTIARFKLNPDPDSMLYWTAQPWEMLEDIVNKFDSSLVGGINFVWTCCRSVDLRHDKVQGVGLLPKPRMIGWNLQPNENVYSWNEDLVDDFYCHPRDRARRVYKKTPSGRVAHT